VSFGFLGVLAWGCALAIGAWMRLLDIRRAQVIDTARRDERLDLARELHDVVARHVAGIVVQAQAARILAAKRPETLDTTLAGIESAGNDALAVQLRLPDGDQPPWPPEVAATVYRIVQEALTNVILHAPGAASVTVTVGEDLTGVTVEVTDDAPRRTISGGSWFAPAGGNGLTGMRERAEALGGTLRAGPGPDGGWVVAAELPLAARRNA
jgi:signal transduction histidine kinase